MTEPAGRETLRHKTFRQLHPPAWTKKGLSPVNLFIAVIVLLSVIIVVVQTEAPLAKQYARLFLGLDIFFLTVFSIEYLARLWSIGEKAEFAGAAGRVRYIFTWQSIVDLVVILPFALGVIGSDIFLLRLLRLARIVALAKLGRYSRALRNIRHAVMRRRHELIISASLAFFALFFASVMLYLLEGRLQPEAFGSIPRAMWWGVATLTTVGYGDVYPVTLLGRVFGGLFAVSAVALIALPTGILAAAFADAFEKNNRSPSDDTDTPRN